MAVASSALITTLVEAREYYRTRLAGSHVVECHARTVTIVFEHQATHLFSDDPEGTPVVDALRVERKLGAGRVEVRRFSLERAQSMDLVLPAICNYTVSIPGTGTTRGREKRMLHGPLNGGRSMRVVLRPGPGSAFTCVSAYWVTQNVWMGARRAKSAKFPP